MSGAAAVGPREPLQIYDPRERRLVRIADVLFRPLRWFRRRPGTRAIRRVLLLRLERIGDLLMVLDAIQDARAAWADAEIDLAVGAWNEPLARLIPGVARVDVASVPWLARGGAADSWPRLVRKARAWRARRYDVVLNFEPDIRTNALAWLTGAPMRVGYGTGGGAAFLTDAGPYAPERHVAANARDLVARAAALTGHTVGRGGQTGAGHAPRIVPPLSADVVAGALLSGARRPLIGIHASGGRLSKQWHVDRFAAVARSLVARHGGTLVLTGDRADRPLVEDLRPRLDGTTVVDACTGLAITDLAALLARLDVFVSSDTGPMHLAAAVGTPVVALFGPSNPARYGPLGEGHHVIRVELPCSPCGQVRLPPERCRGHVPDCMDGIQVDAVVAAADEVLGRTAARDPNATQVGTTGQVDVET